MTPAGQPPALKPCPACGMGAHLYTEHGVRVVCDAMACVQGPNGYGRRFDPTAEAVAAWNALPRLADGLRPEAATASVTGFALLDEAARHALEDTAETVLWLRRAVTVMAERHGVKLPPAPRLGRRTT